MRFLFYEIQLFVKKIFLGKVTNPLICCIIKKNLFFMINVFNVFIIEARIASGKARPEKL